MTQEEHDRNLEEAAWDCVLDNVDVNNPVLLPKYKELLTYLFKAGAQWRDAQIPKLPDSIDEAAQKVEDYYDVGEERGYLCCHRGDIKEAFKAGAEWAMNQGVKTTGTISPRGIIYDTCVGYHLFLERYHNGDKVKIQIRKIKENGK